MFESKKPKEKAYSGYVNPNQDGLVIVLLANFRH